MITGLNGSERNGVAAHLWPSSKRDEVELLSKYKLNAEDIESPRNSLFLLKELEGAFDRKELCFTWDPFAVKLKVNILNPKLLDQKIREDNNITYHDIDQKPINIPSGKLPFLRILSFHAEIAFAAAYHKRWIKKDDLDLFKGYSSLKSSQDDDN